MKTLRLIALAFACALPAAQAAGYPEKPIRIIVPFTPGGSTDILARMIGQKLQEAWGQQVIADNRPGANGVVAAEITAKANPDGHTLMFVAIGHAINPLLQKNLPDSLPTPLANACRAVAHQVIDLLQIPLEDNEPLPGLIRRPSEVRTEPQASGMSQSLAVAA